MDERWSLHHTPMTRCSVAGVPLCVMSPRETRFGSSSSPTALTPGAPTPQNTPRRGAAILGYDGPEFWNIPDRSLEYGEILIARLLGALETHGADLLYAPSWWEIHPDHLALALAAAEAVRRCPRAVRLVMYEVGVPLHPSLLLDITDLRERKQAAMACFESQLSQQAYDQHIAALNRFRTYSLPASVLAAEAFRLVSREELRVDPRRMIRPGDYYRQSHPSGAPAPLVSIVLLGWNAAKLIDALDALALQTYPNLEVLLVTDQRTAASCRTGWSGRCPLRVIDAPASTRWATAANLGLKRISGEYLAIVDDTAMLDPDHIHLLTGQLIVSTSEQAVYGGVRYARTDGDQSAAWNSAITRPDLWGGTQIPLPACLFARALIDDGCRFDEGLDALERWDFLLQVSQRTDLRHLNRITVACREPEREWETAAADDRSGESAFEKWRFRWSGRQIMDMLCRRDELLRRSEQARSALRQRLADNEEGRLLISAAAANLQAALDAQMRSNEGLHAQLTAQADDLQRLTSRVAQLDAEKTAILSSTSWRITGPLRWLVLRSGWISRKSRQGPS